MKKILFLWPLFLIGCTISQKIVYRTDDLATNQPMETIPAKVEVRILEDNRRNIEENNLLFDNPRQVRVDKKTMCINSEKHYAKDTVVTQITHLLVDHLNQERLFQKVFYNTSNESDYYLTGTLNSFFGEQEFSTGAAIGAGFGLIGALATSGIKTPGKIIIDISDLKLFKKDGTLVKDFGSFYKEYNDEYSADSACWCIYWNMNEMLKDFNTQLIEKIRNDLHNIKL
ncbi:hypothetical protein SAMN05444274_11723 [Mariniphaga anaerophila]|uniref:Lipoprotein n=1 Tax=Mariniphaga anaerophila TaxID=1484053 RepID=A0A1M5G5M3_9BACT|nr:hypothetical protein [Mariniphaga anaerophila]SHF99130.1 hypothetical protein SAMN05444274_11723 [Mariniphaga anaerophila]